MLVLSFKLLINYSITSSNWTILLFCSNANRVVFKEIITSFFVFLFGLRTFLLRPFFLFTSAFLKWWFFIILFLSLFIYLEMASSSFLDWWIIHKLFLILQLLTLILCLICLFLEVYFLYRVFLFLNLKMNILVLFIICLYFLFDNFLILRNAPLNFLLKLLQSINFIYEVWVK